MTTDQSPWRRRIKLLRVLFQRGQIATAQAARILGVDRRKARADLQALELNGVPLRTEGENRDRRWVIDRSWQLFGVPVGLQERLAMLFGRELVDCFLHDTDFGDALQGLAKQFEALDPLGLNGDLNRRFFCVHEPQKDYGGKREILDELVRAILGNYRVSFEYTSARGENKPYTGIAPLTLAIYKRGVYLLFERRDALRTFAVERIDNLQAIPNQTFDYPYPSEYNPKERLADRYGISTDGREPEQVVLRFAPHTRAFVEGRTWMPGQTTKVLEDGSIELTMMATGYELGSMVLQFGDAVEVIEPRRLRERVKNELQRALAKYA